MPTPTQRLAELGLTLPAVVTPLASYLPAVRSQSWVFTSGQLPMVDGVLPATGRVGTSPGDISADAAAGYARICGLNALAAIDALVGLDAVQRVVKVVGFVASAPDFYHQPAVVNGASTLLGDIFGDAGQHARSAVGVMALPLNAPVEVELIVEIG